MPMDFPDMDSLRRAAALWKFREPHEQETEQQYRTALADFIAPNDFIESEEIRNGCGWDKWNEGQNRAMLGRAIFRRSPLGGK